MLIPVDVCNKIQRHMNGFWWEIENSSKSVCWMACDRLCNVKEEGDLGFKDLKQFNIAMLAKQDWHLLNDLNPLVTGIMKVKYFPNTNFLSAQLGDNPSYMWRRIIVAQEVMKQGCVV